MTLDEELRGVLVELCLQKQLPDDDNDQENRCGAPSDYMQQMDALTCEVLFYCEYRRRRDGLLEYLRVPPEYAQRFSSTMTCGGLRALEYCCHFLSALFWVNPLSPHKTLLRPLDLLADIGELHVLAELVREIGRRIAEQLDMERVGPGTATVVEALTNLLGSVVGLYNKKRVALTVRGDKQQYRSYREFIRGARVKNGKVSASLSSSSSSSSLDVDAGEGGGGGGGKTALPDRIYAALDHASAQQARSPRADPNLEELQAYLAYVWFQMALNGRGAVGVEDLGSGAFVGSVLERDLLAAIKLQPQCTATFALVASGALQTVTTAAPGSYRVNPAKWPMRALLSQFGQFEHSVESNRKRFEEHCGGCTLSLSPSEWPRAARQCLWVATACKIARLSWAKVGDGLDPEDQALVGACLAATDALYETMHGHMAQLVKPKSAPVSAPAPQIAPEELAGSISTSDDSDEERDSSPARPRASTACQLAVSKSTMSRAWEESGAPTLRRARVSIGARTRGRTKPTAATTTNPRAPNWIRRKTATTVVDGQ